MTVAGGSPWDLRAGHPRPVPDASLPRPGDPRTIRRAMVGVKMKTQDVVVRTAWQPLHVGMWTRGGRDAARCGRPPPNGGRAVDGRAREEARSPISPVAHRPRVPSMSSRETSLGGAMIEHSFQSVKGLDPPEPGLAGPSSVVAPGVREDRLWRGPSDGGRLGSSPGRTASRPREGGRIDADPCHRRRRPRQPVRRSTP